MDGVTVKKAKLSKQHPALVDELPVPGAEGKQVSCPGHALVDHIE
jgi:hypothetical protein